MKQFVCLDGEAIRLKDGSDILTIMQAADRNGPISHIERWHAPGLYTEECFQWIVNLNETPNRIFVGFSFRWDFEMMLADVGPKAIESLIKTNRFFFTTAGSTYSVEYLNRKILTISRGTFANGKFTVAYYPGQKRKQWVQVYDVWGFFQSSFVQAVVDWKMVNDEELAELVEMKGLRGEFGKVDRETVRHYNIMECVKTAKMMHVLDEKITSGLGVKLKRWHGAGAIAQALYEKYQSRKVLPKCEHDSLTTAYFGGRIQTLKLGHFTQGVYSYDIRSAYPAILAKMPLFLPERIRQVQQISDWCICKVRWKLPDKGNTLSPFPFRLSDKSIQYPTTGIGWYHSAEVLVALRIWPEAIEILEIWEIPYDDSKRPFSWIKDLYSYRSILRSSGDLAHICIKLGLNSLYGKCAQKVGYRGQPPAYRSFMVAGAITAGTRAMLLSASKELPEAIIMYATDGIASLTRLTKLELGTDLGLWEEDYHDEIRVYQAGLYAYFDSGGVVKSRTRSVMGPPKETRQRWWDDIANTWRQDGIASRLQFREDRFITAGLASSKLKHRTFQEIEKCISLYPNKGVPVELPGGCYQLLPIPGPGGESRKYVSDFPDSDV